MSVPMTEGPAMMPMAYTDWKKPMAVERCSSGTSRIAADMMREKTEVPPQPPRNCMTVMPKKDFICGSRKQ